MLACTVPDSSCIVMKASLPKTRLVMTRPATATGTSGSTSSPSASAAYSLRSAAAECVTLYVYANGSTPASRIASTFASRTARSSETVELGAPSDDAAAVERSRVREEERAAAGGDRAKGAPSHAARTAPEASPGRRSAWVPAMVAATSMAATRINSIGRVALEREQSLSALFLWLFISSTT